MGNIVSRNTKRIRCDLHPCRETAVFTICEGGRRQVAFNVCEKHLRQIIEEGLVELKMLEEPEKIISDPEPTKEPERENADFSPENEQEGTTAQEEPENETEGQTEEAESTSEEESGEVYSCKYCGTTFPKTKDGRIALMTHSRTCPSKPPKE